MTALGARAPVIKPCTATMLAITKIPKAVSQWPSTAPIARPRRMLTTWAPPTNTKWTNRSYIVSCAGRSLPCAVAYSRDPCSAIRSSSLAQRRGITSVGPPGQRRAAPRTAAGYAGQSRWGELGRQPALRFRRSRDLIEPDRSEPGVLLIAQAREREVLDGCIKQPVEIEFRSQMQKHRAKSNGGAIHEHELARHGDRPALFERLVHAKSLAPAVVGRLYPISQAAHPIIQKRPVNEARPDVERLDHLATQALEPPGLVCTHDEIVISAQEPVIKVEDAAHELGGKYPNEAIVQQIDPRRGALEPVYRVIPQVRVAMDHAIPAERPPPS